MRLALVNHFKGTQVLTPPEPALAEVGVEALDLKDIKGQETALRALEVTAAGGHNLLMLLSIDRSPLIVNRCRSGAGRARPSSDHYGNSSSVSKPLPEAVEG